MKAVVLVGGEGTRLRLSPRPCRSRSCRWSTDRSSPRPRPPRRARRHGGDHVVAVPRGDVPSVPRDEGWPPRRHLGHGAGAARDGRRDRERAGSPRRRAVPRAERGHPDGPGPDRDARSASVPRRRGHDRAPSRGGRARVRPRRDGSHWPHHGVPGEAAGSGPRGHQRRTYVLDPRCSAAGTLGRTSGSRERSSRP